MGFCSRQRRVVLRACWLALMAIAFVWQPALLAAAEAHERVHALATGEGPHGAHDDHAAAGHAKPDRHRTGQRADVVVSHEHGHGHGRDSDRRDGVGDSRNASVGKSGGGLHALLHAMHCCGHPTALPGLLLARMMRMPALVPPVAAHSERPGPLLADPLRPPIGG